MTTATSTKDVTQASKFDILDLLSRFGALIFLIGLCIVFAILEPAFLKFYK